MSEIIFVYVTTKDTQEAKQIALAVVNEKLAACANILPQMNSIYRWDDEVHDESETVLILKTRKEAFDSLASKIRELHSYDCPCIVVLPIVQGHEDYLRWIKNNVR